MLLWKNDFLFVGVRKVSRSEFDAYFVTLASSEGGACEVRCEKSVYDAMTQAEKLKYYTFEAEFNPSYKNQMKVVSVA